MSKAENLIKLLAISSVFSLSSLFAANSDNDENTDMQALKNYIDSKRLITVKELGGKLSISGEVRTEYQCINETKQFRVADGEGGTKLVDFRQRGSNSASGSPTNNYDIEVNLMLDYRAERSWASVKIEFDNKAGADNGSGDHLDLEKAYFGVRLAQGDTYTFDIDLGRRPMGNIFDSRIEFNSNFDGILFQYGKGFEKLGDFYVKAGPLLVNENKSQYAYAGEVGLLTIMGTGFYAKYSLVDWHTKDTNSIKDKRYQFIVSQGILGYVCRPELFNKKMLALYAAGLVNTDASALKITADQKENIGWYAGFSIGELRQKGDWAWDSNFQWVEAQAVPEFDSSGIGLGNAVDAGFYTKDSDGSGDENTNRHQPQGSTNFKGIDLKLDFLATNNIVVSQEFAMSRTLDRKIGPFTKYKKYELELIYAF